MKTKGPNDVPAYPHFAETSFVQRGGSLLPAAEPGLASSDLVFLLLAQLPEWLPVIQMKMRSLLLPALHLAQELLCLSTTAEELSPGCSSIACIVRPCWTLGTPQPRWSPALRDVVCRHSTSILWEHWRCLESQAIAYPSR